MNARKLFRSILAMALLATVLLFRNLPAMARSTDIIDPNILGSFWTVTGNLDDARGYHTATLLSNGQVLIAGGHDNFVSTATAEVFIPSKNQWHATGSMNNARHAHTATLLRNGIVLVTGGTNQQPLASAEIYMPRKGIWKSTGTLNTSRALHTATLLQNGKVLVAGGCNTAACDNAITSAEVYDPATGIWTTTGSLNNGRYGHIAVLLRDGRVLVAGGSRDWQDVPRNLASAEIYDPMTGSWSTTGSMASARYPFAATLLRNGKVLVTGGWDGYNVLGSAEIFDPSSGTWSNTGSMTNARYAHAAVLLSNGHVLIMGGLGEDQHTGLSTAEDYNPVTGKWKTVRDMPTARLLPSATLLRGGKVLVTGGYSYPYSAVNSAELYMVTHCSANNQPTSITENNSTACR